MLSLFTKTFINEKRNELRSGWQVVAFYLLWLILAVPFFLITNIIPALKMAMLSKPSAILEERSILLVSGLITSAICVYFLQNRSLSCFGYGLHKNWWKDFIIGAGCGFLMIAAIVLIENVSGSAKFMRHSSILSDDIYAHLFCLVLLFVAASLEEVIFRGFPLQSLARGLSPIIAALLFALPFGSVHLGNPNASIFSSINTVLAGIWLAIAYFKTRSLWLATGLHWSWNFTMGIIFGLPISGIKDFSPYALFSANDIGPQWFTGGNYGPEGGAVATLLLTIGTIWLLTTKALKVSPEMATDYSTDQKRASFIAQLWKNH